MTCAAIPRLLIAPQLILYITCTMYMCVCVCVCVCVHLNNKRLLCCAEHQQRLCLQECGEVRAAAVAAGARLPLPAVHRHPTGSSWSISRHCLFNEISAYAYVHQQALLRLHLSDAGVGRRATAGERDWLSEKDALEQTIGILRPVERALLARPPEPPAAGGGAHGYLSLSLSSCYSGSHQSINSLSSASASSAGALSANSLRKLSASHHSSVEYVRQATRAQD